MLILKTRYDGKKVVVPHELRGHRPTEVILIADAVHDAKPESMEWLKAQEPSFARVWDNEEDTEYDRL